VDPFELLKKDHKKVSQLLNKLEKAIEKESSSRDELFQQIKSELELHTQIEETIFYPALKGEEETKDITLEAYEEHKEVKNLLEALSGIDSDDETWAAKCKLLKENIEHHVEEEEGEMFKKARKALEREELEQLGDQMAQAKGQSAGMTGEEGEEEDELEMEMAGASQSRGSNKSASKSSGGSSSRRSQASAARPSGSRSRSKSSVKSASRRGSKSSSSMGGRKKSSRSSGSKKKSSRKSSRRR
jgi:hypothetical protein